MARKQNTQEQADEAAQQQSGEPEETSQEFRLRGEGELAGLRDEAAAVREEKAYDGTMTVELFNALQGLMYRPIPERFVETLPETTGKPYVSTGIRSVQVQVDRMNAIVGPSHWRVLTFYPSPDLCKAVVVVGNNLQHLQLDETGQLTSVYGPDGHALSEVLVERHGYGGHKAHSKQGDSYKGSETNALKRTLARLGIGAEVYALDFDDHPETGVQAPAMAQPGPAPFQGGQMPTMPLQPGAYTNGGDPQQAPPPQEAQPQRGQPMGDEQASGLLDALLAEPSEHQELRQQAHQVMQNMPQPPGAAVAYGLINSRKDDPRQLQALIERASTSVPPQG